MHHEIIRYACSHALQPLRAAHLQRIATPLHVHIRPHTQLLQLEWEQNILIFLGFDRQEGPEGLTLEKCFLASDSREGGGFWMVISNTFMGG